MKKRERTNIEEPLLISRLIPVSQIVSATKLLHFEEYSQQTMKVNYNKFFLNIITPEICIYIAEQQGEVMER